MTRQEAERLVILAARKVAKTEQDNYEDPCYDEQIEELEKLEKGNKD